MKLAAQTSSRPDHTGLLFRAEPEPFIKPGHARAEPKQFNVLKGGMVENPSNDLGADLSFLILAIDDHVPNRRPEYVVGQHAAEAHQASAIPGRNDYIRLRQHRLRLFKRTMLGPGACRYK